MCVRGEGGLQLVSWTRLLPSPELDVIEIATVARFPWCRLECGYDQ